MSPEFPYTRDLVLIGGGHTHALVLRRWGMSPLAGARVTLINPGPTAPYSGMLPGFVAGHYGRDDLDIDLVALARFARARFIDGAVHHIDVAARLIHVAGRPPVAYDVASVDVGITSAMPALDGFAAHGVPAKPLGPFATRWDAFRADARDPHVAVIGGGVAGAELAMAMSHALTRDGATPTVNLIDRGRVLSALGHTARQKMRAALTAQGVRVIEEATIAAIAADHVALADGTKLRSDFTTGAAGARPHDWISGLDLHQQDGFIAVDAHLQSSDPAIFAVGDCAHMTADPRPKAGVFAVRQAPVLFDNLRAVLAGQALRPYKAQKDYLKLISLGQTSALAEKFGTARAGPLLWRLKDHIDQKFMRQFRDLPVMSPPATPRTRAAGFDAFAADKVMCGGCGAKVGRAALQEVLGGDGDDAAVFGEGANSRVISTDHLRAFWEDPVVMARIAATHALGDIWAMGGVPDVVTTTLILPRMAPQMQQRTLRDIAAAVGEVVETAGGKVVGGHSSLGAEMTIGLTVVGRCGTAPKTLAGAQPGDRIILTKPLGTGVVLAGHMQGRAVGADVMAALAQMQMSQARAADILSAARAMTDVTGFGLAGHLAGLCAASGVAARVTLAAVPVLSGAVALAEAGVRSTLFADNVAGAGPVTGGAGPMFDLLFDPQTAGGLMAAVPAEEARGIEAALQAAGYAAADIGEIEKGAGITVT